MANKKYEELPPQDPKKKNSPISDGPIPESFPTKAVSCHWEGQGYSNGAVITSGGRKYECSNGTWYDKGPAQHP